MYSLAVLLVCFSLVQCCVAVQDFPGPSASSENRSRIWGVLVAGSNGWDNYCDQASICRAYQLFKAVDVPDSNIVVMMFDDIAYNQQNPEPGVIRSTPNGPNVYKGVPHDYTNTNLSVQTLLHVLRGEVDQLKHVGSGKALQSGPDDYVVVVLASHGGPGYMAFYDTPLTAKDLMDTIDYMHSKHMYKKMVFFVDSCYSGSMFYKKLPPNIDVFATTAANPHEVSYDSKWSDRLKTYQCSYYSCAWLKDMEKIRDQHEKKDTVEWLYEHVKKQVNVSHVSGYGDQSAANATLSKFFGKKTQTSVEADNIMEVRSSAFAIPEVARPDVSLAILTNRILLAKDERTRRELEERLQQELQLRESVRRTLRRIVEEAVGKGNSSAAVEDMLYHPASPHNFDCLKPVLNSYSMSCHGFSKVNYACHASGCLANLCDSGIPMKRILRAIQKTCNHNSQQTL